LLLINSKKKVYRLKDKLDPTSIVANSSDLDEKLVYTVIKESGNKGIWIREISMKTNVKSTALNKTLKNLETKKLIKSVASVNASKKKVYMLFDLEPDRSITGKFLVFSFSFLLVEIY
jgi:DNA-directed RNA polymerase III subunit RPC6